MDFKTMTRLSIPSQNRRRFLKLLVAAAASYPLASLADKRKNPAIDLKTIDEPWQTIAAVQEHLFPSEDKSPGASDINALQYLKNMLTAPDMDEDERQFIINGEKWLNQLSLQIHSKKFIDLDTETREQILRKIEQSRAGENWLSTQLTYILEALLSDPVYGGNPNGIGWTWLQHQPGFPTPSTDKMYYKLGRPVYRSTKS